MDANTSPWLRTATWPIAPEPVRSWGSRVPRTRSQFRSSILWPMSSSGLRGTSSNSPDTNPLVEQTGPRSGALARATPVLLEERQVGEGAAAHLL
jgi:hypothetical protein